MGDHGGLLKAARRILAGAARDLERGRAVSACVATHRAALLATQAWLEAAGQSHVSASVAENVALSPAAGVEVRRAAALLDRHRLEEGYPHRSSAAAIETGEDEARRVVAAGREVIAFVDERIADG